MEAQELRNADCGLRIYDFAPEHHGLANLDALDEVEPFDGLHGGEGADAYAGLPLRESSESSLRESAQSADSELKGVAR